MKISENLKTNLEEYLTTDVEQLIGLPLTDEAKNNLKKRFKATIGTHLEKLNKTYVMHCIESENKIQIAIQNWKKELESLGYDEDFIETRMIQILEKENINLCR